MSANYFMVNMKFIVVDETQKTQLLSYCEGKQWLEQIDENLSLDINYAYKYDTYEFLCELREILKAIKKEIPSIAFKGSARSDATEHGGAMIDVTFSTKPDKTRVYWREVVVGEPDW